MQGTAAPLSPFFNRRRLQAWRGPDRGVTSPHIGCHRPGPEAGLQLDTARLQATCQSGLKSHAALPQYGKTTGYPQVCRRINGSVTVGTLFHPSSPRAVPGGTAANHVRGSTSTTSPQDHAVCLPSTVIARMSTEMRPRRSHAATVVILFTRANQWTVLYRLIHGIGHNVWNVSPRLQSRGTRENDPPMALA